MKKIYIWGVLPFILFACVSAEQNSDNRRWDVKVSTSGSGRIWVWKYDGSRQCDSPAQITPEGMARELKGRGIMVYEFRKGSDGMVYPSVCGAKTGATVELEIDHADLEKVQRVGFQMKKK